MYLLGLTVLGQQEGSVSQQLQSQPDLSSVWIHQQQGLKDGQQLDRGRTAGHLDREPGTGGGVLQVEVEVLQVEVEV